MARQYQYCFSQYKPLERARRAEEACIKAFEERPTLEYRGVWVASVSYAENSAVTHNGGVCIAKTANHGVEPPGPQWRLAVKKGRDGRDLR